MLLIWWIRSSLVWRFQAKWAWAWLRNPCKYFRFHLTISTVRFTASYVKWHLKRLLWHINSCHKSTRIISDLYVKKFWWCWFAELKQVKTLLQVQPQLQEEVLGGMWPQLMFLLLAPNSWLENCIGWRVMFIAISLKRSKERQLKNVCDIWTNPSVIYALPESQIQAAP